MKSLLVLHKKRLFIIFSIALFVLIALLGRLSFVQLIQGSWLTGKAENLWGRDIPFSSKRGRILDRNGELIAYNISSPSVMVVPAQIKDKEGTADKLANILQVPAEKILPFVKKKQLIVRITPYGRKISEEKAEQIQGLQLPGVVVTEDSKRYYPYQSLASHLLGFTGIDNQGLAGLELEYNKQLQGTPGYISFSANARGEKLPGGVDRFTPPKDGLDLKLTIDLNIQKIMERELDQAMAQYQPENVIAIAMEPTTGEILGMSSRPTYRPDQYKTTDPLIYNRNLPIWKTYEPGSTFKIITLAAALQEKKVNLKQGFFDPGFIAVGGSRLRCWKSGGHGSQTFLEVVENSCNPGFVTLGQRLGKEKLLSYIHQFGFGQKTGIDLNGEAKGILFKPSRMGPVELATTAFGQGVAVTPIQQVAAVAATVNGGKLMVPHLAKQWMNPESGKAVSTISPTMKREVLRPEISEAVRAALESVVARGSGRKAFVDGYRVGGKTGTAQKVGPNGTYLKNNHIVSFIGFAPADDPKIVVYLAVDNPKGIQFGGVVAAPIVGNIIGDSMRYMKVPKRKNQIPPEENILYDPIIATPNFVGQDMDKIRNSLYTIPIETVGKGKVVISQIPRAGERIKKGTVIRLYLGDK
ncbi:stage V sporulation protein D [Shimazuella kribbensis]|uniref:stage V sporulation protein D n=1 Tax=Shimazuella kribbensis TaxID=139808 RepID=UPI000411520A|nr:stage V sporulation protein D [Shimazuella kribbensis]